MLELNSAGSLTSNCGWILLSVCHHEERLEEGGRLLFCSYSREFLRFLKYWLVKNMNIEKLGKVIVVLLDWSGTYWLKSTVIFLGR